MRPAGTTKLLPDGALGTRTWRPIGKCSVRGASTQTTFSPVRISYLISIATPKIASGLERDASADSGPRHQKGTVSGNSATDPTPIPQRHRFASLRKHSSMRFNHEACTGVNTNSRRFSPLMRQP